MSYKERSQAPEPVPMEHHKKAPALSKRTGLKKQINISLERAKAIAMDWHSGQWSPLYAFGSSGILLAESVGRTLREININVHSENLPKSQLKRLQQRERFITGHPSAQECIEQPKSELISFNQ